VSSQSLSRYEVKKLIFAGVFLIAGSPTFAEPQPYAGQQAREIKALTVAEIQAYLSGAGSGYAKAAELNHYPGPKHAIENAAASGCSRSGLHCAASRNSA